MHIIEIMAKTNSMKVLIVDDDFISRSVMLAILSKRARCDVAVSAEEALLAFKTARKEKDPYDLVFLDILMPGERGTEVLNQIAAFEDSRNLTGRNRTGIIMVSSIDDPKEIMDAFRDQCDGYLIKPVKNKAIMDACAKIGKPLPSV